MMCGASLGSVLVGSEFTVRGRARRKETERAMVHGWLVARAKGGGYLWLARQSCSGGLEALLLIQGGVHWDFGDFDFLAWRSLGFDDFGNVL